MRGVAANLVALVVGAVLAFAAAAKLLAMERFVSALAALGIVWPAVAAVAIVAAETVIVALLIIPATRRLGLASSVGVLILFAAGLLVLMIRGDSGADCSCFGVVAPRAIGWPAIFEDLGLALMAALALRAPSAVRPHVGTLRHD